MYESRGVHLCGNSRPSRRNPRSRPPDRIAEEDMSVNEKQLGEYLLAGGVLRREELQDALGRQTRMHRLGLVVPIGEILLRMGIADRLSIETALVRQRLDNGTIDFGNVGNWTPFRTAPEPSAPEAEEPAEGPPEPPRRRLRLLAPKEAGTRAGKTPQQEVPRASEGAA
jgi:hypothetical protein